MPFMNKWVTAQCPARIDVSGGWSDTPPITYEHGGAVTMIGLQIRGKVWSTTFMYHMIMLICKLKVLYCSKYVQADYSFKDVPVQ